MNPHRRRQLCAWLALLAVAGAAAALRYGVIEPSEVGDLCSGSLAPAWCHGRALLVRGFQHHAFGFTVYGSAALLAAALALRSTRPWLAWLAAASGAFALELYCFEPGALALLIGCLRLLRLQSSSPGLPGAPHRQRQQQVQSQP